MDTRNFIDGHRKTVQKVVEDCFVAFSDIPKAQTTLLDLKSHIDEADTDLQKLGAISQMARDTTGSK